jgi:hypothetical protein
MNWPNLYFDLLDFRALLAGLADSAGLAVEAEAARARE